MLKEVILINSHIMICGLGGIGTWVLEMLARTPNIRRVTVADVNETYGRRRTNSVQFGASQLGYFPNVDFHQVDVTNIDQTAELLRKVDPDLLVSSMTLLTWHSPTALPEEKYEMVEDAGLGPFLPAHLLLQYKLMQAVERAEINPLIVETSFPDAVSPVLHRAECPSPTIGIGNLDNLVPPLKLQVARELETSLRNVQIYLVSHHICNVWFSRKRPDGPPPFQMKIFVNNQDLTDEFDTERLMYNTAATSEGLRIGGTESNSLTASSVTKHILALINDANLFTHAPGPKGLVGGYPIYLSSREVELALPNGITEAEAIKINQEGQKRDGIKEIQDDGTVVFTDKAVGLMNKALGYKCKTMELDEVEERAEELVHKFQEQAEES